MRVSEIAASGGTGRARQALRAGNSPGVRVSQSPFRRLNAQRSVDSNIFGSTLIVLVGRVHDALKFGAAAVN